MLEADDIQVLEKSDLNRLCQVSRRFYETLNPRIWSDLTIGPSEINSLDDFNVDALNLLEVPTDGLRVRAENLRYVKDMCIGTTFRYKTERRCSHPVNSIGKGRPRDFFPDEDALAATNNLGEQLSPIFLALEFGQLRSFRYFPNYSSSDLDRPADRV